MVGLVEIGAFRALSCWTRFGFRVWVRMRAYSLISFNISCWTSSVLTGAIGSSLAMMRLSLSIGCDFCCWLEMEEFWRLRLGLCGLSSVLAGRFNISISFVVLRKGGTCFASDPGRKFDLFWSTSPRSTLSFFLVWLGVRWLGETTPLPFFFEFLEVFDRLDWFIWSTVPFDGR